MYVSKRLCISFAIALSAPIMDTVSLTSISFKYALEKVEGVDFQISMPNVLYISSKARDIALSLKEKNEIKNFQT
jgi:hypothetical protein